MTAILRKRAEEEASYLDHLKTEAERAAMSVLHGDHRQKKPGSGERFWQFREYNPSDRPQDIDWRQSGKTDRVFIRQREWQTSQSIYLWCARGRNMDFASAKNLPRKIDTARIFTLALAILGTHAGEQVGMLGGSGRGRSENALQRITAQLMEPGEESLPSARDTRQDSRLFAIGDFLDPADHVRRTIESFASVNGTLIQILDPAEIELPYEGRIIFEDAAQADHEKIDNVGAVREEYRARIAAHIEALKQACTVSGWDYFLHRTDRPVRDTLLKIRQAQESRKR